MNVAGSARPLVVAGGRMAFSHEITRLPGGGVIRSSCHRRLPEVLAAQGPTIEVLHTLRPLIVVMAGANEFDPYQD